MNTYNYTIDKLKPLTDTVVQVMLYADERNTLDYLAGQYIEIITHNGEKIPFSIANAPLGGRHLELHIRHTPENPISLQLLQEIKQEGHLTITGPFGQCIYHENKKEPIIFLAGGTGFAPMKALIEHALMIAETRPMHLYWGAKTASDLYYAELAEHWAKSVTQFTYTPVLSKQKNPANGSVKLGFVHEMVIHDHPDLSQHQVYAAGPPIMVSTAANLFFQHGLLKENFFSDLL